MTYCTLIAIICSGVGATGLGASSSFVSSVAAGTSPGTKVFTDSFLACSSASSDANKLLASNRSYINKIKSDSSICSCLK